MPSFDSSVARGRIDTLTANLQRVRAGKAYGIDTDGALIGEALKSSFKGKVVDLLVARGIAKQGDLGGRIATGLVGRQNFDLIRNAHADPKHRGSIANALALIEKYELAGVDDAGLDRDIASRITSKIASTISMTTPLRALAGGRIAELHEAIWNDVVPRRLAWRAELADDINSGRRPKSIAEAGQVALDEAARAILAGRTEPGQLDVARQASGGQGNIRRQAEHIVADYNEAVHAVRSSVAEGEDANARVTAFTGQFIGVLKDQYEAVDVADGIGPRIDGTVSRPIKSEPNRELRDGEYVSGDLRSRPTRHRHRGARATGPAPRARRRRSAHEARVPHARSLPWQGGGCAWRRHALRGVRAPLLRAPCRALPMADAHGT